MVFVKVRDGEDVEGALRRFKRDCEKHGILKEVRKREHHNPPSVLRKIKQKETERKIARKRRRSN